MFYQQIKSNRPKIVDALLISIAWTLLACHDTPATAQQKKDGQAARPVAPKIDLHMAIANGNIAAVKQHIAAGTDINVKDAMGGSSPLITACLYEQLAIAKWLLTQGADINFKNNDGSTALHVAAFFCKPDMVKLLLQHGANKTIKNKYGSTALETVSGPYSTVKPLYEQMKQLLEPIGVKLNLDYIEKTRPFVASLLK
jgi:ankyrin repeat protein